MAETSHLEIWKARDEAATETLERFRKAAQGMRWQTQAFLEYLGGHWFEEKLRVRRIMRLCSITDKSFATYFHADLGEAPRDYIRRVKMEVAAELLRTTNYEIALIGEAVGIPAPTQFSRDFRRWSGETPGAYRVRANGTEGPVLTLHDPQFVKAAFAGELTHHEAELYVAHIHEFYSLPPPTPAQVPDSIYDENLVAEVVLRRLRNKTFEEQKKIVKYQYDFRTPALFDLLLKKSRQEARRLGPQRGICWVELALVSLEDRGNTLGSDIHNLKTRGWAWLGNARRQVFDFPGAAIAFEQAEQSWDVPRVNKDSAALADLLAFKASFRFVQRDSTEALSLSYRALNLLRILAAPEQLAQALIMRGCIKGCFGQPDESIIEFEEALNILDTKNFQELKLIAVINLTISYLLVGRTEKVEDILPLAKALAEMYPMPAIGNNILWIEGLLFKSRGDIQSAERILSQARKGFAEIGQFDHEAVTTLELALIQLESGSSVKALRLASETIPFFESFKIRREAIVALQLIRSALSISNLTLSTLREIKDNLNQLRQDPWFGNPGIRKTMNVELD